jgi:hypothetical protein
MMGGLIPEPAARWLSSVMAGSSLGRLTASWQRYIKGISDFARWFGFVV